MESTKKSSGYFIVDLNGLDLDQDTLSKVDKAIQSAVTKTIAEVSDVEGINPFGLPPGTMGLIMR